MTRPQRLHSLGLQSQRDDPSGQRCRSRCPCVRVGAFLPQVCGHLGDERRKKYRQGECGEYDPHWRRFPRYKLTLRAVRRTLGRTKAKSAAGMSGRKRRGERRRSEGQPQVYGALPKGHSWDSDRICAVRSDGGSRGKIKCFYSSLCQRTNEASPCHNGHGRNDKKPEGETDCEGQDAFLFSPFYPDRQTPVIIMRRQKLTCQRNQQRRGVFKGHISPPVYKGSKNFQDWTGTLCIICSKRPRKWRLITVQLSILTIPTYFYVIK